ncbi:MAG: hypothetical protein E7609_07465 [Ruminococcaceae bacterium]|nr:hypothetical protein [Oscillospiraceae bacterium]
MAAKKDYFGLSRLVSLILAIIPITALVCGIITRFQEGAMVPAVVRLIVGLTGIGTIIVWVLDLVCMILNGKISSFLGLI